MTSELSTKDEKKDYKYKHIIDKLKIAGFVLLSIIIIACIIYVYK